MAQLLDDEVDLGEELVRVLVSPKLDAHELRE
jgi:hypothetical protein